MTENVKAFPKQDLDLQKTVENIANNGIAHAIVITYHDDGTFKVHTTADKDLTAELLWDSLTIFEPKDAITAGTITIRYEDIRSED